MLAGKKVIVGVTGSIAAYKAAILVRLLVKAGAEVRVLMTPLAKEFTTPLTLATLSKHPILVEFFNPENGEWNSHVRLGLWADAYVIAPATANTIAKMANGVADNLLLTTYLSAHCPVFVAPAMDLDMFAHPATQTNLETLRRNGDHIIEPEAGELASGLEGKGRMEEPERIVTALDAFFAHEVDGTVLSQEDSVAEGAAEDGDTAIGGTEPLAERKEVEVSYLPLKGRKIMVTAGPTIEPIDPVRYISNHSSGKMGYALAEELSRRGAEVVLVSGKTALETPQGVQRVDVMTAEDMYRAAVALFPECDGAVMCAAVADYTPVAVSDTKIKKQEDEWTLTLHQTHDIAAELGRMKGDRLLVGFALETDHEQENASKKLQKKNLDFIVLNSLAEAGAGFGVDTNRVTIIDREGGKQVFGLKSKHEVACDIVDEIEKRLNDK